MVDYFPNIYNVNFNIYNFNIHNFNIYNFDIYLQFQYLQFQYLLTISIFINNFNIYDINIHNINIYLQCQYLQFQCLRTKKNKLFAVLNFLNITCFILLLLVRIVHSHVRYPSIAINYDVLKIVPDLLCFPGQMILT